MAQRLSLPEKDEMWGISVIRQNSVRETYPSHCHDFYEIFFISSGKGTHCVGEQRFLLEKGSLVLIRPDDVHSFSAFNSFDFSMYSVGFTEAEMRRALGYMEIPSDEVDGPAQPPQRVLHGHTRAFLEQELDVLLQQPPRQRPAQLRLLLPGILRWILQSPDRETHQPMVFPGWLSKLDEEMSIRENYVQGLSRMQELCPCTQAYMNRAFKRYMKVTPTEYINIKRLHYASELLLEGKHGIAEICYMTGFNNLSHFYSVFRQTYQCTPKAFCGREVREETPAK